DAETDGHVLLLLLHPNLALLDRVPDGLFATLTGESQSRLQVGQDLNRLDVHHAGLRVDPSAERVAARVLLHYGTDVPRLQVRGRDAETEAVHATDDVPADGTER